MLHLSRIVVVVALAGTGTVFSHAARAAEAPAAALVIPRLPAAGRGADDLRRSWRNRGVLLGALASDDRDLWAFDQFGATARVAFDDVGLRAFFEVTDATPVEADHPGQLHEWDSVELLVRGKDEKGGFVQLVVSPGRTSEQSRPRQWLFDYRSRTLRTTLAAVAGTSRVETTATGYVAELVIPWSNFGAAGAAPPSDGDTVGIRVSINDRAPGESTRRRMRFVPPGHQYDFNKLPPAMLGKKAAGAPLAVTWGGHDDHITTTFVNIVAERGAAGKTVTVTDSTADGARKKTPLATGKLQADGGRARLSLMFPVATRGETRGPLQIMLGARVIDTLALQDAQSARQQLFRSGASRGNALAGARWEGRRGTGGAADWAVPTFGSPIFRGPEFPAFAYPEPGTAHKVFGDVTFKIAFYDSTRKRSEHPRAPGRYGAVVTATTSDGTTATSHHTLIYDPAKGDRDWWHAVRRANGDALKYEYFVRPPAAYEGNHSKKWPLIVFLHGSGGGEKMESVRDGGPQEAARTRSDFPFVVLSLRSPGGWHPPAVKDVIDEVAGKYRIDEDRIYLTGFSMGGMGTWDVVFDQPRRFAAIAPVGGRSGHPNRASEIRHVPVWIFNGAADGTTTSADAMLAVDALKAVGAKVRFTDIPGAGHVDSHDITYTGTEIYDWFLQQKRTR